MTREEARQARRRRNDCRRYKRSARYRAMERGERLLSLDGGKTWNKWPAEIK